MVAVIAASSRPHSVRVVILIDGAVGCYLLGFLLFEGFQKLCEKFDDANIGFKFCAILHVVTLPLVLYTSGSSTLPCAAYGQLHCAFGEYLCTRS
jgi:hypothetical protein